MIDINLRNIFIGVSLTFLAANSMAMPAHPAPAKVLQSDGSELTVRVVGDEFYHYTMTSDGYTVMKSPDGDYKYAVAENGMLVPGSVTAHDPSNRNVEETRYLAAIGHLRPSVPSPVKSAMKADRQSESYGLISRSANYDYHKFRGLVILVEYDDCSFSMSDPLQRFTDIVTKRNYTGFGTDYQREEYTGSVVDYFYDNSATQFEPQFDVVGPVKISKSQYFVNANENIREVISEAIQLVDPVVDFSQYDGDNNGEVDMFYVIFAGGGSNFAGNDSRLVWPHAWTMTGEEFDGKKLGRYACSTELYGPPAWKMCDGIGTICHEFSHVLGLMDEYDTDYEGSGGLSNHPGDWSLMASGGYLNNSRTPTGYSLMQRYQSGFCVPVEITEDGDYTLEDLDAINNGFRISTSDPREYFLLENRRKDNKWNAYNHGAGMLVHRVDSTNTSVWTYNNINANPSHNYYYLLRAVLKTNASGVVDHDGDPFPGSYNVTTLDYDSDPSLVAWSGKGANFVLSDIAEDSDGRITFHAYAKRLVELVEDFEDMVTSGKYDADVEGRFTNWTFYNGVVDTPENGWNDGNAAGLFKNGYFETAEVEGKTNAISLQVYNPSSRPVTFNVRYCTGGNNWDYLYEPGGLAGIAARSNETAAYRFDIPQEYRNNLRIQVRMANNSGSTSEKVYFDNISFIQDPGNIPDSITPISYSDTAPLRYSVNNGLLAIECAAGENVTVCDLAGRTIHSNVAQTGQVQIRLNAQGIYILRIGSRTARIIL